jgi:hypothetical protein
MRVVGRLGSGRCHCADGYLFLRCPRPFSLSIKQPTTESFSRYKLAIPFTNPVTEPSRTLPPQKSQSIQMCWYETKGCVGCGGEVEGFHLTCVYYRQNEERCGLEGTWDLPKATRGNPPVVRSHKQVVFWRVCPACYVRRLVDPAVQDRERWDLSVVGSFSVNRHGTRRMGKLLHFSQQTFFY